MALIAVIDYGMGNLRSVSKALEHVAPQHDVVVTSDAKVIADAARVVFPGQGAMPDCMRELDARHLRRAVIAAAHEKPFLGICIGLQMLFAHSEEVDTAGLGLLKGRVKRFAHPLKDAQGTKLKVPHMGWNQVTQSHAHPLWAGIANDARFYHVHSYYAAPEDDALETAYSAYPNRFTTAVGRDNLFAVQFHAEKSASAGLQLLSNFVSWQP
jgi:glutamine amidotransferase